MCNSIYKPWYFPWSDRVDIEVQKALTGRITADQCCDTLNTVCMHIVTNACESGFGWMTAYGALRPFLVAVGRAQEVDAGRADRLAVAR